MTPHEHGAPRRIGPVNPGLRDVLRSSSAAAAVGLAAIAAAAKPDIADLIVALASGYMLCALGRAFLRPVRPAFFRPSGADPAACRCNPDVASPSEGTLAASRGVGSDEHPGAIVSDFGLVRRERVAPPVDVRDDRMTSALAVPDDTSATLHVLAALLATGTADAIVDCLAPIAEERRMSTVSDDEMWRAAALLLWSIPLLVWLRDHEGVPLTVTMIREAARIEWIAKITMERVCLIYVSETRREYSHPLRNPIPPSMIRHLQCLLAGLPGYDPALPLDKQGVELCTELHTTRFNIGCMIPWENEITAAAPR